MLSERLGIMVHYTEPVVVNHCELCWANGCESWRIMLCQWMWMMLFYVEPVVVNHDVSDVPVGVNHDVLYWASRCESWWLCWASGCETLWMIFRYWLWIIVSCAGPVVMNHCALCWAGCVGIMVCFAEPVIMNHCELCGAGCVGIMVRYAEHDVNAVPVGVNHSFFFLCQ
jgi:hypothetical protein